MLKYNSFTKKTSLHRTDCLRSRGGSKGGDYPPLKPKKVTLFTMISYNSEKSIRDIWPFCRPLFCHSGEV